jgi:hypothetical protein
MMPNRAMHILNMPIITFLIFFPTEAVFGIVVARIPASAPAPPIRTLPNGPKNPTWILNLKKFLHPTRTLNDLFPLLNHQSVVIRPQHVAMASRSQPCDVERPECNTDMKPPFEAIVQSIRRLKMQGLPTDPASVEARVIAGLRMLFISYSRLIQEHQGLG